MFEVPVTSKIWQQGTALTPPALPACSQQVLLAVSPPMGFTCGGGTHSASRSLAFPRDFVSPCSALS